MEALNADGTRSIAFLHNHCLDLDDGNLLDFGGLDLYVKTGHFLFGKENILLNKFQNNQWEISAFQFRCFYRSKIYLM